MGSGGIVAARFSPPDQQQRDTPQTTTYSTSYTYSYVGNDRRPQQPSQLRPKLKNSKKLTGGQASSCKAEALDLLCMLRRAVRCFQTRTRRTKPIDKNHRQKNEMKRPAYDHATRGGGNQGVARTVTEAHKTINKGRHAGTHVAGQPTQLETK